MTGKLNLWTYPIICRGIGCQHHLGLTMDQGGKSRQLDPESKLGNEALHSSYTSALIIKVNSKDFKLRQELGSIKTFVL